MIGKQQVPTTTRPTLHEESRPRLSSNQALLLMQPLKSALRALHYESGLKKKTIFLIYHFMALTWPRGKKRKKTNLSTCFRATCSPTYERLKPWSLLFDLNGVTHELIVPQTNNINNNNLGPNNKPRNAQISHYWPPDLLVLTPTLKVA